MEVSNEGSSIYHRLLGIFQFAEDGSLLSTTTQVVEDAWFTIHSALQHGEAIASHGISTAPPTRVSIVLPDQGSVIAYKFIQPDTFNNVGILLQQDDSNLKFEEFFTTILLAQLHLCTNRASSSLIPSYNMQNVTHQIVELFGSKLRYAGANDQWDVTGKKYFAERIQHFVERGTKLELCLPAFPCKSSSTDKVLGSLPDLGEMMALEWLHAFVEDVEKIYPPGAKLWIVSDGHVFSDCIGADDGKVDEYTARLKELNDQVAKADRIGFKSLVDLFSLSTSAIALSDLADHLELPQVPHHVATEITTEAELCRRILMSGSHASRKAVRQRIEGQDKSILALYRGFSRFMLEDLELHPATRELSKTKRRKIATAVSFEMIMRNQAYSNLVEMVFPNHVRLSIHTHPNTGPKFGITLFDRTKVTTTSSISNLSVSISPQQCSDLLHIPTPWHNCIVELPATTTTTNDVKFIVTKAKVVREALDHGTVNAVVKGDELQRYWKLQPQPQDRHDMTSDHQQHQQQQHDNPTTTTTTINNIIPDTSIHPPHLTTTKSPIPTKSSQPITHHHLPPPPPPPPSTESDGHSNGSSISFSQEQKIIQMVVLHGDGDREDGKGLGRLTRRGRARAVAVFHKFRKIWKITFLRPGEHDGGVDRGGVDVGVRKG